MWKKFIQEGVNWRAAAVQFGLMAVFLPGVIHSADTKVSTSTMYQKFYATNWFVNTFCGWLVYWVLCLVFPVKETLVSDENSYVLDGHLSAEEEQDKERAHIDVISKEGLNGKVVTY